jgi:plasmid stabilization system protein ParE
MNRHVIYRPEAAAEIEEAVVWYEAQFLGLGSEFFRTVEGAIATIQRNPYQYQIVRGDIRRALLRRFPYKILYTIREDEILIVACSRQRRDPKRWMNRR